MTNNRRVRDYAIRSNRLTHITPTVFQGIFHFFQFFLSICRALLHKNLNFFTATCNFSTQGVYRIPMHRGSLFTSHRRVRKQSDDTGITNRLLRRGGYGLQSFFRRRRFARNIGGTFCRRDNSPTIVRRRDRITIIPTAGPEKSGKG